MPARYNRRWWKDALNAASNWSLRGSSSLAKVTVFLLWHEGDEERVQLHYLERERHWTIFVCGNDSDIQTRHAMPSAERL